MPPVQFLRLPVPSSAESGSPREALPFLPRASSDGRWQEKYPVPATFRYVAPSAPWEVSNPFPPFPPLVPGRSLLNTIRTFVLGATSCQKKRG